MRLFLILFYLSFHFCNARIIENNNVTNMSNQANDTITILFLNGKYYINNSFKVVYVIDETENKIIYLIDEVGVVSSILLPKSDEGVKNFSVDRILKTNRGFQIIVSWGGGSYFYHREFYFNYIKSDFYLDSIKYTDFFESDKKTICVLKKLKEPVVFKNVDIRAYIVNE